MYTRGNNGRLSIFIFLPQHFVLAGSRITGLNALLPLCLNRREFKSRCNSEGYFSFNTLKTLLQFVLSVNLSCFLSFLSLLPRHTDGVAVLRSLRWLHTNSVTSSNRWVFPQENGLLQTERNYVINKYGTHLTSLFKLIVHKF